MEHILAEFKSAYFIEIACKRLVINSVESNEVEDFRRELSARLREDELVVLRYIKSGDKEGLVQMLFDCKKHYETCLEKIVEQMNDALYLNPNSMSTIFLKEMHTNFLEKIRLQTLIDATNEFLKLLGEI